MKKIYYVYTHKDPCSGEVVYVGKGQKGRAWDMQSGSGPKRSEEHFEWFLKHEESGLTMGDVVSIVEKGLSKDAALKLEKSLIKLFDPSFNRKQGRKPVLSEDTNERLLKRRSDGLTVSELAEEFGVSEGTVYRVISAQSDYKKYARNQFSTRKD